MIYDDGYDWSVDPDYDDVVYNDPYLDYDDDLNRQPVIQGADYILPLYPCPACGRGQVLTAKDVAWGFMCHACLEDSLE